MKLRRDQVVKESKEKQKEKNLQKSKFFYIYTFLKLHICI